MDQDRTLPTIPPTYRWWALPTWEELRLIAIKYRRVLFGLVVAIALLYVQGRVAEMDDRLFQPSVHGIQGLFQYQLGRYGPAAAAYRADLRNDGWKEWQNGDEAYAALLRGNLSEAARLADLRLRSNQTMRKPGSRRARSHWKKETSDVPQMRSITRHY